MLAKALKKNVLAFHYERQHIFSLTISFLQVVIKCMLGTYAFAL